ncbi:30S ribosomal protein S1 [Aggregatilinea lenta]|uniref:30S ribosomal protein S1 n=1 Tax=Aggregatilinea lenta TaxID=913108 RepID=UPI000E5B9296|nr:S1 RNA-binding domain-containing protein [Aggregatilinea lenta]
MTTELRQYGSSQPLPPDEGYWEALLHEGEVAAEGDVSRKEDEFWDSYDFDESSASAYGAQNGSQADWEQVQQVFDSDTTVELRVIGHNRGGLLVEWSSLRGFIPASQLVDFPVLADVRERRDHLAFRIGQTLKLRVIELDQEQNRLILSERAAQVQPGTRATVLNTIQEQDICSGQVTNLCDFGVFVDLGGLEGLIHISELSWGRVGHPRDVLARGQTIQVFVLSVDQDQGRVALSLKRLRPDPWKTVEQRYTIGQTVEGKVTNVVDFGAFVCIEEGLEGLIHVSELAEGHFLHPRNVVHEGETVRARVLNIDGRARRLGLSLRR